MRDSVSELTMPAPALLWALLIEEIPSQSVPLPPARCRRRSPSTTTQLCPTPSMFACTRVSLRNPPPGRPCTHARCRARTARGRVRQSWICHRRRTSFRRQGERARWRVRAGRAVRDRRRRCCATRASPVDVKHGECVALAFLSFHAL